MKARQEVFDLLSLLKVFDANYVSDEDCMVLHGLNVNHPEDLAKAVKELLVPEFHTYPKSAQKRLMDLLHMCISDSSEDFSTLFERVELAFDDEIIDRRAFMSALLICLESLS